MNIQVTSYPDATAITTTELARIKTFLRIEDAEEDDDLADYYLAAAQAFEKLTGRCVFETGRRYAVEYPQVVDPCVTGYVIELPYPKLIEVTAVKYFDEDDAEQTLDETYYNVAADGDIGRVTLKPTGISAMSSISTTLEQPIVVYYTSGWGKDTDDVPLGVKNWMREFTKWTYNTKGRDSDNGIPAYLQHLAGLWKLGKVWP